MGNKLALIFEMVGILKIWRNLQKGLLETLGTSYGEFCLQMSLTLGQSQETKEIANVIPVENLSKYLRIWLNIY